MTDDNNDATPTNNDKDDDKKNLRSTLILIGVIMTLGTAMVIAVAYISKYFKTRSSSSLSSSSEDADYETQNTANPTNLHSFPSLAPSANLPLDPPILPTYTLGQLGSSLPGVAPNDWFGNSVSLSSHGRRMSVGASNHNGPNLQQNGLVQVFDYSPDYGNWSQVGSNIYGFNESDRLGFHVSLSFDGTYLGVSSISPPAGYARTFRYSDGDWTPRGQTLDDCYAISLSHDGSRVVVAGGTRTQLYSYHPPSDSWTTVGQAIFEENAQSVALAGDGSTVVIGSPYNDDVAANTGRVRVFKYDEFYGANLYQMGKTMFGSEPGNGFGMAVDATYDGSIIVVGNLRANLVKAFEYDEEVKDWAQRGDNIVGDHSNFGWSVSLSQEGDRIAVGSPWVRSGAGTAAMYQYNYGSWVKISEGIRGRYPGSFEGWDVSLSPEGDVVASGARKADENGLEENGRVSVYEFKSDASD